VSPSLEGIGKYGDIMKENQKNSSKLRIMFLSLSVALVLTVTLVTMSLARPEYVEYSSENVSQDILILNEPGQIQKLAANWHPTEILNEVREVAMADQLREIFAKFPRRIGPAERAQLAEMLVVEGRRAGIDPLFLAAVIRIESAFYTGAISNKGARGLMQVMPATGQEVAQQIGLDWTGPDQLHDLHYNVRLGVHYLDELLDLYAGNYKLAVTAYNRGPHNVGFIVRRHGWLKPRFTEYFRKIQQTYRAYLRSIDGPNSAFLQLT
jgi:soluble lytic murein transglycosylase-like protein